MPLNEGQTVQYTVVTTRVADGTVLYWKTTGNTTISDIVGGNTGSITITNNQAVFNVTTSADQTPDGIKTLGITILTDSINGTPVVNTSNPILINDTSNVPPVSRLYAWGYNIYGVLGLNNTTSYSSPVLVGSSTTWNNISDALGTAGSGGYFAIATKTDGTLWGWGYNVYGNLGLNGDTSNKSSPTLISSGDWSKVDAGDNFATAIKLNGTLWGWGKNDVGQIGKNDTIDRSSPVQVGSDTNWLTIGGGDNHFLATKTDGTLWGWGINNLAQLGISGGTKSSPTQIGALTNWSSGQGGKHHSITLKNDGTLWLWGYQDYGQVGNSSRTQVTSPLQIGAGTTWLKITAGQYFNHAITSE